MQASYRPKWKALGDRIGTWLPVSLTQRMSRYPRRPNGTRRVALFLAPFGPNPLCWRFLNISSGGSSSNHDASASKSRRNHGIMHVGSSGAAGMLLTRSRGRLAVSPVAGSSDARADLVAALRLARRDGAMVLRVDATLLDVASGRGIGPRSPADKGALESGRSGPCGG